MTKIMLGLQSDRALTCHRNVDHIHAGAPLQNIHVLQYVEIKEVKVNSINIGNGYHKGQKRLDIINGAWESFGTHRDQMIIRNIAPGYIFRQRPEDIGGFNTEAFSCSLSCNNHSHSARDHLRTIPGGQISSLAEGFKLWKKQTEDFPERRLRIENKEERLGRCRLDRLSRIFNVQGNLQRIGEIAALQACEKRIESELKVILPFRV